MSDPPIQPSGRYTEDDHPFASRGGLKLDHALAESGIDPTGFTCADLGSSTGGFTSCLLLRGAEKVYAVDTGYGILDYKLRTDPRVAVMERSNALHVEPPPEVVGSGVDLVVIDLGWTRQTKALPAALRWLKPGGRVITLIKPHYEVPHSIEARRSAKRKEPMPAKQARRVAATVLQTIDADAELGLTVLGSCDSPIRGGKGGNLEVLAWLTREP